MCVSANDKGLQEESLASMLLRVGLKSTRTTGGNKVHRVCLVDSTVQRAFSSEVAADEGEKKQFKAISEEEANKLWPAYELWNPPTLTPEQKARFIQHERYSRENIYLQSEEEESINNLGKYKLFSREFLFKLFPEGLAGEFPLDVTMVSSRTSPLGIMVRKPAIEIINQLKISEQEKDPRTGLPCISRRGFFLDGHKGSGKSYILNHVVSWCRERDWLCILESNPKEYLTAKTTIKKSVANIYLQTEGTQQFLEKLFLHNREYLEKIPIHKNIYGSSTLDGTHKLYAERAYYNLIEKAIEAELEERCEALCEEKGIDTRLAALTPEEEAYEKYLRTVEREAYFKSPPQSDERLKFLAEPADDPEVMERRKMISGGHEVRSHTGERREQIEEAYKEKMEAARQKLYADSGMTEIERNRERIAMWKDFKAQSRPVDITSQLPSPETLADIVDFGLHNESFAVSAAYELMEQLKRQREFPLMIAVDGYNEMFSVSKFLSARYDNTQFNGHIPGYHLSMPRLLHKFDGGEYVRGVKIVANSFRHKKRRDQDPTLFHVRPEEIVNVKNFTPHEFSNYVAYMVRKKILKYFPESKLSYYHMVTGGNGEEARRILGRLY